MSRKENPPKLIQLSSRSHPRHLVGKRTAQKDTIIDITSDSQVKSNLSVLFIYFILLLFIIFFTYLYVQARLFIKLSYGDAVTTSLIYTLRHDVETAFSPCSFNTIVRWWGRLEIFKFGRWKLSMNLYSTEYHFNVWGWSGRATVLGNFSAWASC